MAGGRLGGDGQAPANQSAGRPKGIRRVSEGYPEGLTGRYGGSAGLGLGCSEVRPVEGRSCSAALKSEDRRPKPERRPKSEFREWPNSIGCCSAGVAINSDLGLRVSFGLRSSGFGFGMARADFRAALGKHRSAA